MNAMTKPVTLGTVEQLRECVATTSMHGTCTLFDRQQMVAVHDTAVANFLHVYQQVQDALILDDRPGLAAAFRQEAELLLGVSAL